MDIATLFGIVGAFIVIASAILLGGSAGVFLNPPSLIIVIGGTFAVTLSQISLKQFFGSFKVTLKAFLHKSTAPAKLIDEAVELAEVARKEGVLALEGQEISEKFLEKGIGLCIDGHPEDIVQKLLSKDINLTLERHEIGIKMFKSIADAAPAMGMIGTLIGLVQMLSSMDDPKKIGPAMAVALLTTLYGAIIANVIAIPIAEKLKMVSHGEKLNKKIILESIAAIQQGTNPKVLRQLLMSFIPESQREGAKEK